MTTCMIIIINNKPSLNVYLIIIVGNNKYERNSVIDKNKIELQNK